MKLFFALGDLKELNTAERTLTLALRALDGEELRVSQLAREYGVSRQTVYRTLDILSLWLPIDSDPTSGCWRLMDEDEERDKLT